MWGCIALEPVIRGDMTGIQAPEMFLKNRKFY